MRYSHSYASLGEAFYQCVPPTKVEKPVLLCWNDDVANHLGFVEFTAQEKADIFSGNIPLANQHSISLAYAGHQFGSFNPQLGDGRAHLIAELADEMGNRFDVQLKGSGPTPYSRRGDGRCALKPALREFIMSHAMSSLGVPTTKSLAVVTTGENVWRDNGAEQGAVVTRVAQSHIRIGTFQYFSQRGDLSSLQQLLDYSMDRHFPSVAYTADNQVSQFIEVVMAKQITMLIEWMRIGFIHGVLNTDNVAISGETIDYGPCAMMGRYSPETVFSSIDTQGRYCFGNQPPIIQWNLARLAESLMPLYGDDQEKALSELEPIIVRFSQDYSAAYRQMMNQKLGLNTNIAEDVMSALQDELLSVLQHEERDYTISFRLITDALKADLTVADFTAKTSDSFGHWYENWREYVSNDEALPMMEVANPQVIPRNHDVEIQLARIEDNLDDFIAKGESYQLFSEYMNVLAKPYSITDKTERYQHVASDGDRHYRTFCGT